ncbi:hypothetical protein BHE90_016859 [Fusarium euwallaceae]|uniref:Uncharacterized protein n=1 Tax=Fusarium euwallaceae TaxID=1147111 RepID=A0A430KZ71_9HYPO|nr:hypothetical protein BHE90_016859 [Fusarium euwallaceae]
MHCWSFLELPRLIATKPDLEDLTIFRSRSQDLADSGFWADARRQDTGSRLASCCVIVVANDYVRCLVRRSLHSGPPRSLVLLPPLPPRWLLSGCFVASRTPWSPGCPCQSQPRLLSSPWTLWTVDLWIVGLGPPAFKADSTDHGGEPFPVRPARCLDTDIDSDFCWPSPTLTLAEGRHFALDRRFLRMGRRLQLCVRACKNKQNRFPVRTLIGGHCLHRVH